VVQDRADFRYRLHDFPMHLNLGYWRYQREGSVQQIFSDASFEGTVNRVFAQARPVNQQVQEGRLGFDAHLGPVDVIYDFKFRSFEDKLSTPVADYVARPDLAGNPLTLAGAQQHNENPDSRFYSHTIKRYSTPGPICKTPPATSSIRPTASTPFPSDTGARRWSTATAARS
jgi:hypothetical protein